MKIRRGRISDAEAIYALVSAHAAAGSLLPRTLEEIRGAAGRFLVAMAHGRIVGCVAIESYGGSLAEIRSLVVAVEARGMGVGRSLLRAAEVLARRQGITRLLTVTRAGEYFERQGFVRVLGGMPAEKVARDCVRCPKSTGCRLVALALDLTSAQRGAFPVFQPNGMARVPGVAPA